jgi:hypothetical protein
MAEDRGTVIRAVRANSSQIPIILRKQKTLH